MRRLRGLLRRSIHPFVRRTLRRWLRPAMPALPHAVAVMPDCSITTADLALLPPWRAPVDHGLQPSADQHLPWWWTLPLWLYQSHDWSLLLSNLTHKPLLLLPVFNHADALAQAMQALLRHDKAFDQLILLDDGSTDPAVSLLLQHYKQLAGIRLIRHAKRAGLAACWQKGLQLAASRQQDLVLLSTDVIVSPGWLLQLKLAAYSGPQIASVSANQQVRLGLPHWWSVKQQQQQQHSCIRAFAQTAYPAVVKDALPDSACLYIRAAALALVLTEQTDVTAIDLAGFLQNSSRFGLQHLQSYKAIVWPYAGHHSRYRLPEPFAQSQLRRRASGNANSAATTSLHVNLATAQQQLILQRLALVTSTAACVKPRKLVLLAGTFADSLLTSVSELAVQRHLTALLSAGTEECLLCHYNGVELQLVYGDAALVSRQRPLLLEQIALPAEGQAAATLLRHTVIRWVWQWSVEAIDVSLLHVKPVPELQLLLDLCLQISQLLDLGLHLDSE